MEDYVKILITFYQLFIKWRFRFCILKIHVFFIPKDQYIVAIAFNILISCEMTGNQTSRISHEVKRQIEKLENGDPHEKMEAANELKRLGSKAAVPYLLLEARDRHPEIISEPVSNIDGVKVSDYYKYFVIKDGMKIPYIDYHKPIISALSELSVPYPSNGNDEQWFLDIEKWIEENIGNFEQKKISITREWI